MSRLSADIRLAQARDLSRLYRAVHEFISLTTHRLSGEWTDIMQMAADLCVHLKHDDWLPPDEVHNVYWHSLHVAETLDKHMADGATLTAALLYEVSAGRQVPPEDLRRMFGDEVLGILRLPRTGRTGFPSTNISNTTDNGTELRQLADRLMAAVATNERTVVLMLAQKLITLREGLATGSDSSRKLAQHIHTLYAPVCRYMGLYDLATELDDEALRATDPDKFAKTQSMSVRTQAGSQHLLESARSELQNRLHDTGIDASVELRARSVNRLASDCDAQLADLDEPFDVVNLFVLTHSKTDCYRALGPIHALWRPRQSRLRDYIASPKDNGYQSLHTEVLGPNGQPMLVLIRTEAMDQVARFGPDILFRHRGDEPAMQKYRIAIREKIDLLPGLSQSGGQTATYYNKQSSMITVFSPSGDQVNLPEGSTALDYAYQIHPSVGNTATHAYINGVLRQLWTELNPADTVEIDCASTTQVQPAWQKYATTMRARGHIKDALSQSSAPGTEGHRMLSEELQRRGLSLEDRSVALAIAAVARKKNVNTPDALYRSIQTPAHAERVARSVTNWVASHPDTQTARSSSQSMLFAQFDPLTAARALCCNPIAGDDLFAQETLPGAYQLHQASCPVLQAAQAAGGSIIKAVMPDPGPPNPVQLLIITAGSNFSQDRINHLLGPLGVSIQQCHSTHPHPMGCETRITVLVTGYDQLSDVIELLESAKGVLRVERV